MVYKFCQYRELSTQSQAILSYFVGEIMASLLMQPILLLQL